MSNEIDGRMEMPKFIKVPTVMRVKGDDNLGGKDEYLKAEARINPTHISSYYPGQYGNDDDKHSATIVVAGAHVHHVDMGIKEFDKVMEEADKAYSVTMVGNPETESTKK